MKQATLVLAAVSLTATAVCAQSASASNPDSSRITVPKAGPKALSATWAGKVDVLSVNPLANGCSGNLVGVDSHTIHVAVAPGAYGVVKAKLTLVVESAPTLSGDFIELVDPAGNTVGQDQQKGEMYVEALNPAPGDWKALVCSFLPDAAPSHDYKATIMLTTKCKAVSPCPTPPKKRR